MWLISTSKVSIDANKLHIDPPPRGYFSLSSLTLQMLPPSPPNKNMVSPLTAQNPSPLQKHHSLHQDNLCCLRSCPQSPEKDRSYASQNKPSSLKSSSLKTHNNAGPSPVRREQKPSPKESKSNMRVQPVIPPGTTQPEQHEETPPK